ncbi:MAG TPA: hypothetical protein PKB09_01265 [Candidatus Saccharibacteria bacterium]|nr:hypothetical protein [Candidatus Saccharibacteria bacterium]
MDRTEFYPAEVRVPLEEPQLSSLWPVRSFSVVQMIGTRPVGHDWEKQQKMDAEMFPEFEKTIFDIEDGVAELKSTGELSNSRVFGMLQHQFLDDLVQGVDTSQKNAGLSQAEIRVLDYLDVVLPISPDDEVVIYADGEQSPRPSWSDYVTQQAEKIQDDLIGGEIQADNLVVTPEVKVRAMREGRIARGREHLKNSAIIAGLGIAALVGGEVVSNAADVEVIGESTRVAANVLGFWAGFKALAWMASSQQSVANEKAFRRRLEFPLFNEADLKFEDIRTEINHEELQARRKHETNVSVYYFDDAEKYYSGRQARSIVLQFLEGVETISNSDEPFVFLAERVKECLEEAEDIPEKLLEMYRLLDKHLPISDKDMVTPVNELTGEKTWRGFFEAYLTKKKKESIGN